MKFRYLAIISLVVLIVGVMMATKTYRRNDFSETNNNTLVVSALPLKNIVDNITATTRPYNVKVLVPPGASPETYEPTPQQLKEVADSKLLFMTGLLDFEKVLSGKIMKDSALLVDLSRGINVLHGDYSHVQHHAGHEQSVEVVTGKTNTNSEQHMSDGNAHNYSHTHKHGGVDPHIWTSPRCLKIMAFNVLEAIISIDSEAEEVYRKNYANYISRLDSLDHEITRKIEASNQKYFMIYHPALSYYSADYGIEQVALEQDGKEPSADRMKQLVAKARQDKIKRIFYQREFSKTTVETIAKDIGAQPVEIDPLYCG